MTSSRDAASAVLIRYGVQTSVSSIQTQATRLTVSTTLVLLIEHHLEVIKTADSVIDLRPEGGNAGGQVFATGTPEDIRANSALCLRRNHGREAMPEAQIL
jgi:excinuclease UvrABC ATPase subunit